MALEYDRNGNPYEADYEYKPEDPDKKYHYVAITVVACAIACILLLAKVVGG